MARICTDCISFAHLVARINLHKLLYNVFGAKIIKKKYRIGVSNVARQEGEVVRTYLASLASNIQYD